MGSTDAALTASTFTALAGRQQIRIAGPSVLNRGTKRCPLLLSGGSLTLLVFDEGTCGRRRPVRGPQGSGYRLTKPMPRLFSHHGWADVKHVHSYPLRLTVQVLAPCSSCRTGWRDLSRAGLVCDTT